MTREGLPIEGGDESKVQSDCDGQAGRRGHAMEVRKWRRSGRCSTPPECMGVTGGMADMSSLAAGYFSESA